MQLLGCAAPSIAGSDAAIGPGRWQIGSSPATVVGGGRGGDERGTEAPPLDSQVSEEGDHLGGPHVFRLPMLASKSTTSPR